MRVRSGQGYGKGQALGKVEGGFSNCLWRGAALSITDGLRLIHTERDTPLEGVGAAEGGPRQKPDALRGGQQPADHILTLHMQLKRKVQGNQKL